MAALCLLGNRMIFSDLTAMGFVTKAAWLGGLIVAAGVAYLAVALLLKVDEVWDFLAMVKRRAGR